MKTQCPACKHTHEIPDEYEGKTIKCPSCKRPYNALPKILQCGSTESNTIQTTNVNPETATACKPNWFQISAGIIVVFVVALGIGLYCGYEYGHRKGKLAGYDLGKQAGYDKGFMAGAAAYEGIQAHLNQYTAKQTSSNPFQPTIPQPVKSSTSKLEVVDFEFKTIDTTGDYWTFSWKLDVYSAIDCRFKIVVEFYDESGYLLDSDEMYDQAIHAGQTSHLSDTLMIEAKIAKTVTDGRARIFLYNF